MFADKHAGSNKAVTVSGYTLQGADAGNYVLQQPAGLTANIAAATLTVGGVAAQNKVYDTTVNAALVGTATVAPLASDAVTLGGSALAAFADKHAGSNKAVTVSGYTLQGADAGNYVLQQPAGLTANIAAATLTVGGVAAQNKVYDTTVNAALVGTATVAPLASDAVTLGGSALAAFADKHAGSNKAVTVSGYTLLGADAANYTLLQPSGLVASISAAPLVVNGVTVQHKLYDGNRQAYLAGTASVSALGNDAVTLGGSPVASFSDATVGNLKPVSVSGFTLSGADAGNYSVQQPAALSASIFALPITPPTNRPVALVLAWPPLPMMETRSDVIELAMRRTGATLDVSALSGMADADPASARETVASAATLRP